MHAVVIRRSVRLLLAGVLAMGVLAVPANADDADGESETQVGGVEVAVHPAIVKPGHPVTLKAQYEADDGHEDSADQPLTLAYTVDWGDGSAPEAIDRPGRGNGDTHPPVGDTGSERPTAVDGDDEAAPVDGGDADDEDARGDDEDDDGNRSHLAIGRHRYMAAGAHTATVTVEGLPDGAVEVPVTVQVGAGSARLRGENRYDTAERISREDFPTDGSADAVVLSRADSFADALASASLATLEHAPVLLVPADGIPAGVTDEIARALGDAGTIYVLGGEAAIPADIVVELEALGYTVERLAGEDRIATSVDIAEFLRAAGAKFDTVVLANAYGFADALAGAAVAADEQAPVLLTGPEALDPRVAAFLSSLEGEVEVLAVGGEAVLEPAVLDDVAALGFPVERLAGESRYETAVEIASDRFPAPHSVVVTTGGTFPDALAGAALAGRRSAPVLLVGSHLTEDLRAYLAAHADTIESLYVLGGEGAVSAAVRAELQDLLRR